MLARGGEGSWSFVNVYVALRTGRLTEDLNDRDKEMREDTAQTNIRSFRDAWFDTFLFQRHIIRRSRVRNPGYVITKKLGHH